MRRPNKTGCSSCPLLSNRLVIMIFSQTFPTIDALNEAFDSKQISARELTQNCLDAIQKHKQLNAWLHLDEEASLAEAQQADELRAQGRHSPLTGVPIGHKAAFATRHWPTTAASKMLDHYRSPVHTTIVQPIQTHETVTRCKHNEDEFGM